MNDARNIDCIVNNDDKFRDFLLVLDDECNHLERSGSFSKVRNMERIISDIESLKIYFEKKLRRMITEGDITQFLDDVRHQYDKFFHSFSTEYDLLNYLKNESMDYFYLRKVYQLSHARGYLYDEKEEELKKDDKKIQDLVSSDIVNYWKMMLFLDYFESFPKFFELIYLKPMINSVKNLDDKKKIRRKRTRDHYDALLMLMLNSIINYNEIHYTYLKLRNNIAHSTFLIENNKLCFFPDQDTSFIDIQELERKLDIFQIVMIIVATELDIRLLKISENKDEKSFSNWLEFFKIYNRAWQNIKMNPKID